MDLFTESTVKRLGGEEFGRLGRIYKFSRIKETKAQESLWQDTSA